MKRQCFHTQCDSLLRHFSRIDLLYFLFSLGALTTLRMRHCMHTCMFGCFSHVKLLRPYGLYPTRLLCPWAFPGKNTGVGCYVLLQGIFLTEGSNRCLLCCRNPFLLSHWGSPKEILLAIYSIIPIITISFTIYTLTTDDPNHIFLSRPYAAVTLIGGVPE